LFTRSLVELEYILNCSPFDASNVPPYLNVKWCTSTLNNRKRASCGYSLII